MKRTCNTCRYWQYENIDRGHVCCNVDSDMVTEWTDAEYSCNHWEQELEQDGWATWNSEVANEQ